MKAWNTVRIDQLGRVVTGKTPSSERPEEFGDAYPFITPSDIPATRKYVEVERHLSERGMESHRRIQLPKKSVCVVCIGATIGKVCMVERLSISNQQINSIIPTKDKSDADFVYYLSTTLRDSLVAFAGGSATPIINKSAFSSIKLLVPEYAEQRKIAAILSAYDEQIENNQRRIALPEKMAEEIYREWFVRMRFPGHEKVKFIKGVPAGWRDQKFGQFCQLQRGYDLPDANVEPGPYPVMASTSIKVYHSQYKVEPPVITTGRSGSLGEVLIVHTKAWPLNTALYVKQFFGNSVFLVYYTLKNMRLENFNASAGVPSLNRNHLNGIPIIVPNKELQDRFDDVVSKFHSQAEMLKKSNEILSATRDKLLPRLISGKLSVENLDIQFPPGMVEPIHEI